MSIRVIGAVEVGNLNLRLPSVPQPGLVDDVGDEFLPADGHDVDAVADGFLVNPPDHAAGNLDAFPHGPALRGRFHFVYEGLRYEDARDVFVHELGHPPGREQDDAGEDLDAEGPGISHELIEMVQVVYCLGLNEFRPGVDLLFELDELRFYGIRFRGDDRARAEPDRAVQVVSSEVLARLESPDAGQELAGIEVENPLRVLVVADHHGVAGEAEDVPDAAGKGEKEFGLEGQPVSVAAGHLKDRLASEFFDHQRAPDRRKAHHGTLMVRHVERIHPVFQKFDMMDHLLQVRALGGAEFAGDDEFSRIEDLFEACAHPATPLY